MNSKLVGIVDEPNLNGKDTLSLNKHANALADFIRNTSTPMTIGIQGEWGSGKTSLLNAIDNILQDSDEEFYQIWINAWEHALLSSPEETLIKIVIEILQELLNCDDKKKFQESITSTVSNVVKGLIRVSASAVGGVKAGEIAEELLGNNTNSIKELRDQLISLSNEVINRSHNPYKKVVIYVDDLDRIEPKNAVQILELLKNIFSIPNCVFVLAIDYQVVVKGLEHKYGKRTEENEWEFRAFFDKIIQLPFMMPMGQYTIGEYVSDLLKEIGFFEENKFSDQIEEIIILSIGGNPRSLKRLVNSLSLINIFSKENIEKESDGSQKLFIQDRNINNANQKETMDLVLFSIVCLQISFPIIYDLLTKYPDFTKWDENIAFKVTQKSEEKDFKKFENEFAIAKETEHFDEPWEQAIFRICYPNPRLRSRAIEVSKYFSYLKDVLLAGNKENIEEIISNVINVTTITSIKTDDYSSIQEVKPYTRQMLDNIEEYFMGPNIRYSKPKFEKVMELVLYIDKDFKKRFPNYFFRYSPSSGMTIYANESGRSKIGACCIKNSKAIRMDFLRDFRKNYRKPRVGGLSIINRRNNISYIEWYTVLIESISKYEEKKELLYSFLIASEEMRIDMPNKILKESNFKKGGSETYKKYLDENFTYEV